MSNFLNIKECILWGLISGLPVSFGHVNHPLITSPWMVLIRNLLIDVNEENIKSSTREIERDTGWGEREKEISVSV